MSVEIVIVQIELITKGDYRSPKPFLFNPNIVVFFTTKVFLNKDILIGNHIELKTLFFNNVVFDKALRLLTAVDYKTYSAAEILKNNIELFRRALFSSKTLIPVNGKQMVVMKSKYVPDSFKKKVVNTLQQQNHVVPYKITFELFILDSR